jgi:hypothetical protein
VRRPVAAFLFEVSKQSADRSAHSKAKRLPQPLS